jgi:hypothetical protein
MVFKKSDAPTVPHAMNQVWWMDSTNDQLGDGHCIRVLNRRDDRIARPEMVSGCITAKQRLGMAE